MASAHHHGENHDHHDHHHHHHQHALTSTSNDGDLNITEINRQHWNEYAAKYTEHQWQRDFINSMTSFLLSHINWIGVPFNDPSSTFESPPPSSSRPVRVLDYACGPGTITAGLDSRATEYMGIDLSDSMVKAYNTRFAAESESDSDATSAQKFTAHAVVGNLLETSPPEHLTGPKFWNFDLAVVGVGFHHFDNVQRATERLVERLRPGGVLLIIDFLKYTPPHDQGKLISHHGFSEQDARTLFEGAGLLDFETVVAQGEWDVNGKPRKGFMAKGRKPG